MFAPLLGILFAKLDLASGLLTPLTSDKLGLLNTILSPFNLVIGNDGTCTPATSPSPDAGWSMVPDDVFNLFLKANEILNGE